MFRKFQKKKQRKGSDLTRKVSEDNNERSSPFHKYKNTSSQKEGVNECIENDPQKTKTL
jgi:hypothetical protein